MDDVLKQSESDKYSLRGRVFNKIREDILTGIYQKDEELKEATIGVELGVSRTPVREALRQLELEGLVRIVPNKGAYVIGIDSKDVHDIYEMRSLLEGLCAKWATSNITNEELVHMEEIIDLSEFYCQKDRLDQVFELDNQFHEIIYNAANSKMLKHTLSDYHHYLERIRKKALSSQKRVIASNAEHRRILNALKNHDSSAAQIEANIHMINTMKNIEENNLW